MMKVLTDEWYAAEAENFDTRNEHREAFWSSVGVTRDTDVKTIDIAMAERLPNALSLLSSAGDKLNDADLKRINAIGGGRLSQYGLTLNGFGGISQTVSLGSNSPSDYKAGFFLTDLLPIFDLAT